MTPTKKTNRLWLALGGVLVVLLAAGVFTLGSLNLPIEPQSRDEIAVLFALSTFIVAALLIFGLILARSLLRLWAERRAEQLGSRFKSKMVLGAMGISLLPVLFMFLFSYGLMNRTLSKWFPRPLEIATEQSQQLRNEFARQEHARLTRLAETAAGRMRRGQALRAAFAAINPGADALWLVREDGEIRASEPASRGRSEDRPHLVRTLPGGAELWVAPGETYLGARAAYGTGWLIAAKRVPNDFQARYTNIETQMRAYNQQKVQLRTYKRWTLLALLLFTVLVLFSSMWVALFLSKQVTVPIQALAEATQEISHGNFDHRITAQAQDELGTLVTSFNQMSAQLGESRRQINDFTQHLQQALEEIERRRQLMETILENIPTGVLSLDSDGGIGRANHAVVRIFGAHAPAARTLTELVGEEAAHEIQQLMRRSLRMGAASRELEIGVAGRLLHAAVTVSSLGPRRANPGFVAVIDDLTELLRGQKAAAWQEVAQRIAHEIKNPLTPIQLSAERLARHLERSAASEGGAAADGELPKLVSECTRLIEREVATLKSLVDEFSQFARFPTARLASADLNEIVASALEVFRGRLDGIALRAELSAGRPVVKADPELLRRVLVNLIDNAAEAMEGAALKELRVTTRIDADGDTVEVAVADTGHGISPEDKDRLFLPHFSTRDRGTGLGLAIASRIVAEHHGTIHVEDNQPAGVRFVIRLPVAEAVAAQGNPGR
jgi:PAS domain S-box-containing protein